MGSADHLNILTWLFHQWNFFFSLPEGSGIFQDDTDGAQIVKERLREHEIFVFGQKKKNWWKK